MDMPHKWWSACVLAFAVPLGLVGTFAGAGTWAAAHARLWPSDRIILGGSWGGTLVCVIGLIVLLRRRTRFVQKPLARQRMQAIAWNVIGAGMIAGLIFAIWASQPWWY
jgi:formate-dependent nitrite reductase membrane component NrfD